MELLTESPRTVATNGETYAVRLRAVSEFGPGTTTAPVMVTPSPCGGVVPGTALVC